MEAVQCLTPSKAGVGDSHPASIVSAATPSGRHRRQSCDGQRTPAALPVGVSMDWPLSREEKRACAIRLFQRDVQAADNLLCAREQEVDELRQEIRFLRRLSSTSTAPWEHKDEGPDIDEVDTTCDTTACSSEAQPFADSTPTASVAPANGLQPSASDSAPAASSDPPKTDETSTQIGLEVKSREQSRTTAATGSGGVEERRLLTALVRYYAERRGETAPSDLVDASQVSPQLAQLACLHSQNDMSAAKLWNSIGQRHELKAVDVVTWLSISMAPPSKELEAKRSSLWRQALLLPGYGPGGASESHQVRIEAYEQRRAEANASAELRLEAETETRAAWKGEAFLAKPGIFDAIVSICLTQSSSRSRHIPGSAEVAGLLLFALLPPSESEEYSKDELALAEADAYWCMCSLLHEVRGGLADDSHSGGGAGGAAAAAATTSRTKRVMFMLRTYDPTVAETLTVNGLFALPAARLGAVFCTRAGFSLETCACLWDVLLSDSNQRFTFCDFIVVALLLIHREQLIAVNGDPATMAEVLLATPRSTSLERLLCVAMALRALERHRRHIATSGGSTGSPARTQSQPPEQKKTVAVLGALGNFFGRVKAHGAGAIESGRNAVRCVLPQAQQPDSNLHRTSSAVMVGARPEERELLPLRKPSKGD